MSGINQRKIDHVNLVATHEELDRERGYFDRIHLTHRALPEQNLAEIDPSITWMGKKLSFPLLISSMTGGSDVELIQLNRTLALAAEAEGVALAVGSQRIMLNEASAEESFALRECAPTALLLGNIGAVQLNYGVGAAECRSMMGVLGADGLFLHLNPLQEAIQPEGDTRFVGLSDRIADLVKELDQPVIVKEVGCGISEGDALLLKKAGVRYVDVAGAGGTSWSLVESKRSSDASIGELFGDWGIPTPVALRMMKPFRSDFDVIASGGIRNGLDMAKCVILGASLCGLARPFLQPGLESVEAVRAVIQRLKREYVTALFLLGVESTEALIGREALIRDEDRD